VRARVRADGSLGSRVRNAHRDRAAYIAVIGDQEVADDGLAVNGVGVQLDALIAAL
jgi:threonyl-tRNA synthetase